MNKIIGKGGGRAGCVRGDDSNKNVNTFYPKSIFWGQQERYGRKKKGRLKSDGRNGGKKSDGKNLYRQKSSNERGLHDMGPVLKDLIQCCWVQFLVQF